MNGTADRVVDALLRADLLDPSSRPRALEVVGSALEQPGKQGSGGRGLPKLVEVVAYLGGALVLAAVGLFLVQEWGSLGFGTRVALLSVATAALLVAGNVSAQVSGGGRLLGASYDVRRRLAGSLLSGGAVTAALLAGHLVDHGVSSTGFDWTTFVAALVALAVAAVGYLRAPTAVGVLTMAAALVTAVLTVQDRVGQAVPGASEGDVAGILLLLTGVLWLLVTELGWFREDVVARVVGVGLVLVGAQVPAIDGTHAWLGYLLTGVVVVAGVALYLGRQAWPYLALAVVGVTVVVPEAVSDWTEGSLGVVGGVLVTGVTLLVASFAGYRLRSEAVD